jgi:hypothetical protein
VVCPATEEAIGSIPAATGEDVEAAVQAAEAAVRSKHWTTSSGTYRAKYLRAIADKVPRRQCMGGGRIGRRCPAAPSRFCCNISSQTRGSPVKRAGARGR